VTEPSSLDRRSFLVRATALSARGNGDKRIEKIAGGNFVRLFGQTWS
jgi:microsomal dipeptidase-like Zn-dependent dipeptidase